MSDEKSGVEALEETVAILKKPIDEAISDMAAAERRVTAEDLAQGVEFLKRAERRYEIALEMAKIYADLGIHSKSKIAEMSVAVADALLEELG